MKEEVQSIADEVKAGNAEIKAVETETLLGCLGCCCLQGIKAVEGCYDFEQALGLGDCVEDKVIYKLKKGDYMNKEKINGDTIAKAEETVFINAEIKSGDELARRLISATACLKAL